MHISWEEALDKTIDSFVLDDDKVSFARSGELTLQISDTGVGMTPEQVATVFRAGVQVRTRTIQR